MPEILPFCRIWHKYAPADLQVSQLESPDIQIKIDRLGVCQNYQYERARIQLFTGVYLAECTVISKLSAKFKISQ